MKPKTLDEIKIQAAEEYGKNFKVYPEMYPRDDFYAGFNASTSQHQKIIADLVSALQEIVDRKGMGVIRNAEMIATEALAAYKQIETKEQTNISKESK